jgi:hypothetical protein
MTVYVVQNSNHVNPSTGQLEPKFNFEPATRFGEIRFLLSPSASPFSLGSVLADLKKNLSTFNNRDFLLLVGNPVLLGLATAIAADYNDGNVNLLQWSGAKRTYIPVFAKGLFS